MSWTKIIFANVLVLFGLVVLLEIVYFSYDKTFRKHVICYPDWILYNYCPNIKTVNKTTKLDQIGDLEREIFIEVDAIGGRVRPGSVTTLDTARLFMIGDSFIQADEMIYADTVYGRWNDLIKNSTYALGYSSWNPIQYFDAIKRIGKAESHYYVFLMINDVIPNYSRSVYGELSRSNENFYISLMQNSFFYRAFSFVRRKIIKLKEIKPSDDSKTYIIKSNSFSSANIRDCSALIEYQDSIYAGKLGFDYLVFSKTSECWPELYRKAFEDFAIVVKEIENYIEIELESNVSFVWIGAGWAHLNQNSIGRLDPQYAFSPSITVTNKGLINEFRTRFPKAKVINTEQLINSELALCHENCVDKYFYTQDGHWTPAAHKLVFDKLKY